MVALEDFEAELLDVFAKVLSVGAELVDETRILCREV